MADDLEYAFPAYSLGDEMQFGKHKGTKLSDVICEYPTYIGWCLDNVEGFDLDAEAVDAFDSAMEDYNDSAYLDSIGYS